MGGRLKALTILLLAALLLSGCNGSKETDEVAFIIGVGLDKAEDRKIKVTFQVAIPHTLGGEKGTEDPRAAARQVTYTAPNLAEAYNLADIQLSRSSNTSHTKMVVFGSELAKDGVGDFMASFLRYREYRGTVYILTVKDGTAEDFIKNIKSSLEILPSKYVEGVMLIGKETGYYPTSYIHTFYVRLKGKSAAPYTALVAVDPMTGRDRPEGTRLPGEIANEYTAGNIPSRGNVIPVNFAGTALFREDKMVGTLTTEETRILQLLLGHLKRAFQPMVDPLAPDKPMNVRIRLKNKPKIDAALRDGRYQFHVAVHLEGEITSIPSGINYERSEYKKQLEDYLSRLMQAEMVKMLAKTQQLQSDVVGFGYHARHLYDSYPRWQEARKHWIEDYGQAEITVTVKTSLRRAGLMLETLPIFSEPSGQ